ncbi:MAG: HD-GYP domain-containing protein, partial [Candidatus Dormiibacterota bacterium]
VVVVVAAVTAIAAVVGAIWIRPPFQWQMLALVAGLVAVLEARGPIMIPIGKARMTFSGTAYASIGAVFVLGPSAALASMLASAAANVWHSRRVSVKTVFNASMAVLTFTAAWAAFHAVLQLAPNDAPVLVSAGAVAGLTSWGVNHLLLGAVLAADQGWQNFNRPAFWRQVYPLALYYLGYGLTGVGVYAAASTELGPAAALVTLAAPVTIVQIATNRWFTEQAARLAEAKSGFNATLISLSKAIDLRDKDTEGHCRRVVEYSLLMGRNLKFSHEELVRLSHGALLHDIGKIGVPDGILMKPGPLTDDEWAVMRTHPRLGFEMVADVRQLERAREIILNHHERFDGKGYPRGLRGEAIPLEARVFTIADSFDAMISDRPYRRGMSLDEARAEVRRCSGTQFDPICVAAFDQISDDDLRHITEEREHPTEELLSLFD